MFTYTLDLSPEEDDAITAAKIKMLFPVYSFCNSTRDKTKKKLGLGSEDLQWAEKGTKVEGGSHDPHVEHLCTDCCRFY